MHKQFLLLFTMLISATGLAQEFLTWEDFADVKFEPEYIEKYGVYFSMPTFGEKIKSYSGKTVSITGHFLNISGSGEVLLVSQFPLASCFFCGGAGPETIIEVNFIEEPTFYTDEIIRVTGILELNRNDVTHCNYILNEATGQSAY